jgi:hypothetical protein
MEPKPTREHANDPTTLPPTETRLVNVEAVGRRNESPVKLPHDHHSQKIVLAPDALELAIVLGFGTFPISTPIVDDAKPHHLHHLLFPPPNIVKDRVIPFQPQVPDHSTPDIHPNFHDFVKAPRNTSRKNSLFLVERAPRPMIAVLSSNFVEDEDAPLPCTLGRWAFPKAMKYRLMRAPHTNKTVGVNILVDAISPSIHRGGSVPDLPQ